VYSVSVELVTPRLDVLIVYALAGSALTSITEYPPPDCCE